jgi:lipoyl(octanoyl) transferase
MNSQIQYFDWGIIKYEEALRKQEILFSDTIERKKSGLSTSNYFIFCEHTSVFTLGKNGQTNNLLISAKELEKINATFSLTNRGGDITYHGPGQIVGYTIFDIDNFQLGLKQFVEKIEETIIQLLKLYQISATRLKGATGVWLDIATERARKICAIGLRSSHFVTMHGFALNVNTDMNYFNYIHPCGFVDKGVTSMERELKQKVDIIQVKENLKQCLEEQFA